MKLWTLALAAALSLGCSRGGETQSPPVKGAEKPVESAQKAEAPPEKKVAPEKKADPPKQKPLAKRSAIKWDGPIEWRGWEEAKALAAKEGKPIALVVYADWCPRCKELAPVFADPEVVELAEKLVMVRQSSDEKPAWLQPYNELGTYVPRVLFIDAEGNVDRAIDSGHPRYPYFYTPRGVERLKASMRKAAGASG